MAKMDSLSIIQSEFPDLFNWATSITRYGDFDQVLRVERLEEGIRVNLWTAEHSYGIRARLPCEQDNGYLGCVVSARKPLAGESWTRGNDLPDGSYSEKTWREIVNGMLAYELVKVKVSETQPNTPTIEEIEGAPQPSLEVGAPC